MTITTDMKEKIIDSFFSDYYKKMFLHALNAENVFYTYDLNNTQHLFAVKNRLKVAGYPQDFGEPKRLFTRPFYIVDTNKNIIKIKSETEKRETCLLQCFSYKSDSAFIHDEINYVFKKLLNTALIETKEINHDILYEAEVTDALTQRMLSKNHSIVIMSANSRIFSTSSLIDFKVSLENLFIINSPELGEWLMIIPKTAGFMAKKDTERYMILDYAHNLKIFRKAI